MKIAFVAITAKAAQLALKLADIWQSDIYLGEKSLFYLQKEEQKEEQNGEKLSSEDWKKVLQKEKHGHLHYYSSLKEEAPFLMAQYDGLVLIMATGIAVRLFAPYLTHKTVDPALVVMDEGGSFAISLCSGHLGGANQLASDLGDISGALPIITTATDVSGKTAFDLLAKKNDLYIENIEELKYISSALLHQEPVALISDFPPESSGENPLPEGIIFNDRDQIPNRVIISNKVAESRANAHCLYLRPKNLVLGIGCRKNLPAKVLEESFEDFWRRNKYALGSLSALASIDIKKQEKAILSLAKKYALPFVTFSADQLAQVAGDFTASAFVKDITGIDNVCERAALAAGGGTVRLLLGKTIYPGLTFAVAEIKKEIKF